MADPPNRSFSEQEAAIMRATYAALCEHGYADLTIKRIAAEYGKSTAAIHYHYETKDDLLAAFLEYLIDQFVETIHDVETTDPEQRLDMLLDTLLLEPDEYQDLLIAMLEMRAQVPHKAAFADRFRQNDEYIRYILETVIDHGIKEGVFAEVDAEHVARALLTIVDGARTRAVVLDEPGTLATARQAADEYVGAVLIE